MKLEGKVADAIAKIFYRSSMDKLEKDENLSAIHNCWEAQRAVIPIVAREIFDWIEANHGTMGNIEETVTTINDNKLRAFKAKCLGEQEVK